MIYHNLKFINIKGEKYPYSDVAKAYWEMEDPKVEDYVSDVRLFNIARPITIKWDKDQEATGFILEYSNNEDMENASNVKIGADITSYDFYNLLKGTKYYLRLTELTSEDNIVVIKGCFQTSSIGPRTIEIDGVANTRDLGGYETPYGTTMQGMIIRTGQFLPDTTIHYKKVIITEKGKKTAHDELGIRTEIDLRQASESETPIVDSPLYDCNLLYYPIEGYKEITINPISRESLPKIFEVLAQPKNYPVAFHCTGGADRTGTLSFLINGFLGVSICDLIKDYEFTSFSYYGTRSIKTGIYAPLWNEFISVINECEGNTIKEKITNYLLSSGVTQSSLDALEKIMFGRGNEVEDENQKLTAMKNVAISEIKKVDLSLFESDKRAAIINLISLVQSNIYACKNGSLIPDIIDDFKVKLSTFKTVK